MRARSDTLARQAARLGAGLALLLAVPGCAAAQDVPPPLEVRLLLQDAAGSAAERFRPGETITMIVSLRNTGVVPRTLTFRTSQTHDCVVRTQDGSEAWRWSSGRIFAQVITEVTIAPGESRAFRVSWNQRGGDGSPLPPGAYRAVGLLPIGPPDLRSEPVGFEIR